MTDWAAVEAARVGAERKVAELQIRSLPIDPIQVARAAGILVEGADLEGASGCLMRQGDQFGILYSTSLPNAGFINFTVGHELGHYFLPGHIDIVLPDGRPHLSRGEFLSDNQQEREADAFSASFLMPRDLFLPALRRSGSGFQAIERLSSLCGTSLTATGIRFASFAEDPVAVILSQQGRIQFCALSEALRPVRMKWLRAGDPIPRGPLTEEFRRSGQKVGTAARAEGAGCLSNWFDGAPEFEMQEDVVGLGSYGRVLTVLFSDEAMPDESDEDDE